ncbi:MAG: hypothetical protein V3U11_03975 [Planctomycetota bacterium]
MARHCFVVVVATLATLISLPSVAAQEKPQTRKATKEAAATPAMTTKQLVERAGGKYAPRFAAAEQRLGGVPGSGPAVMSGLKWLQRHQDEDGHWDSDGFMMHDTKGEACDGKGNAAHDVGLTGLAALALLADGNTPGRGLYRREVRAALDWLVAQQDGRSGRIGTTASHTFIYDHAIAAYALCEGYGLSDDAALKDAAQKAIDYLEMHRNPFAVWRYQPRDGDNDISVTSWAVSAYAAAQDFGLDVNEKVFGIAAGYINVLTDPTNGRCGYTRRGEPSARSAGAHSTVFPPEKGEALTAAALFCRFRMGREQADQEIMKLAAELVMTKPPVARKDSIDHYYWYYGSQAMYQVGGQYWARWSAALQDALIKTQRQDNNFKGSWDPTGVWGREGGRVYATAMATLALSSGHRYARAADTDKPESRPAKGKPGDKRDK